ncbi:hypothetical protein KSP40_PGU005253 [Platanthera guangdongensis]|uniref:Bifunctional inhibitor/plant lipid transfer protein/seed storage helical domain-containing protein n=1 Tax=Platanthera guangdongensis TaxID=2320717 RepID=A0ABR2LKW9_9ASPA
MGDFAVRIEVFAAMMLAATILVAVAGQQQVPSCAEKLVPCANYIASPKPPESCCGPVKEAVKDELPCLCSLFNNPQLIAAFSINLTQALQLPKKCGIQSSKPLCNSTSTSTPISPAKGSHPHVAPLSPHVARRAMLNPDCCTFAINYTNISII